MANLTYPNRVNTKGIPTLLGVPSVETIGAVATLVITFQPHLALNDNWSGLFLVDISSPVATGVQPVVFRTAGVSGFTPLTMYNGLQATAAELETTTGGAILCLFDRSKNKLQLIGTYE